MAKHTDLVVVGGGPAGLEAAVAAAEAGADVALIDGYGQLGGQYFKQLSGLMRSDDASLRQKQAQALFRRYEAASVKTYCRTIVWSAEAAAGEDGWKLNLKGPGAPEILNARTLVVATGVYDRPVPFPGWTLPGVVTAGGVQIMLKTQRILTGKRFLLSGTGPLQMALAAQLIHAGAEVAGVLEANRIGLPHLRYAPAIWGQWAKIKEGWDYLRTLRGAGVKVQRGFAAVAAKGHSELEKVVVARLDKEMRPVPGSERTVAADTLVIGYGFLPSNELTRMLNCDHKYVPEQMHHLPVHNEYMQTSIPSVFVAGDGAGVGGVALARIEGRIAGAAAANRLGRLSSASLAAVLKRERRDLQRERRFAQMLNRFFRLESGVLSWADDDTLICRCEEVSRKAIADAVSLGCHSLIWAKRMTRAGMGMCQGRVCGQWIARLVAEQLGEDPAGMALDTARPPLRPVPMNYPEVPQDD